MKRVLLVLVALTIAVSLSGIAQTVQMYWQPERSVVFDAACPYLYVRPDIDTYAVYKEWRAAHPDRQTSITMADMPLLDVFFGDNDLVAFWHQIKNYGPIDNLLTLSKMKTVTLTRVDASGNRPEPSWTCSLGECLTLLGFFDLKNGTVDDQLPDRYQE